jgi:hypothetical protein
MWFAQANLKGIGFCDADGSFKLEVGKFSVIFQRLEKIE